MGISVSSKNCFSNRHRRTVSVNHWHESFILFCDKRKKFLPLSLSTVIIIVLAFVSNFKPAGFETTLLRVIMVQGNAGYFGQNPEESFKKYYYLTDMISEKPDLLIWPESSYPSVLTDNYPTFSSLVDKSHEFPILIGTLSREGDNIRNSAFSF